MKNVGTMLLMNGMNKSWLHSFRRLKKLLFEQKMRYG